MKNHIFTLMLSSAICMTSPIFAMFPSTDDMSSITTPHQTKGGLYLADPIEFGKKPLFFYQGTEESDKIRIVVDTLKNSQLEAEYPMHFTFYERNELSKRECHKYALAKLFGYETMPAWIHYTFTPSDFDRNKYLKPSSTPTKGDLVVYYSTNLVTPTHFGIFDGVDRVISTWGTSMEHAVKHPPFFTPEMYGKKITFYTFPEGVDLDSIRKGIEKEYADSRVLRQ